MPVQIQQKIAALGGGVGASKLLLGLYEVIDTEALTTIVNTGDDLVLHGLRVSPDLDIVADTLAGLVAPLKGWGGRGEAGTRRVRGCSRSEPHPHLPEQSVDQHWTDPRDSGSARAIARSKNSGVCGVPNCWRQVAQGAVG